MGSSDLSSPEYSDLPLSQDRPQRVLVASPDAAGQSLLMGLSFHEGYQASCVASVEGLLRGDHGHIDMLLLHVSVDDPDSFELCADLRATETFQHVPILIACDRRADPEWVAAALLSGADDVCSITDEYRDELRARIRVQLRNKRYRDAIGRLRAERNDLRTRNTRDALTGVLGRAALETELQSALASGSPFAVLFCDVDHFKSVNDTFGHQVGDAVLKDVAKALSHGCRSDDACGRYGGEEFVLLLRLVSTLQAVSIAERHRRTVTQLTYPSGRGPETVTVSIGIANYDPEAPDVNLGALLTRADHALYRAKKTGRNRVIVAPPPSGNPASVSPQSNPSLACE